MEKIQNKKKQITNKKNDNKHEKKGIGVKVQIRSVVLLVIFLISSFAAAHLEAGIDEKSGPYVFDLGWDPIAPNVGQATALKISVRNATTEAPTNLTMVWVRFEKGNQIWFAGPVGLTKNGDAALSYSFAETGEWTVHVSAEPTAWVSANIVVPGKATSWESLGWIIAGLLAAAMMAVRITHWKNKTKGKR